MAFGLLDIVGHLSFGLTAISFLMRDILLLHMFAAASGVLGLTYNYFIPEGPLWLVLFWLAIFTLINLTRIIMLTIEKSTIQFSEDERDLYQTLFRKFSPLEFLKLMRLAEWRIAAEGEVLAREDEPVDSLKLIYNGAATVSRDGAELARLRDGNFIGEVTFLQNTANATATVTAARTTRYLAWSKDELRKLLRRNPAMDTAMSTVIQVDLTGKLADQGA
jgi:hypothetical protein